MRTRPLLSALLFLILAAIAVVGYLFLLNVLAGKAGPVSAAIPAAFLALAAGVLNWRFLKAEGRSLADVGLERPLLQLRQMIVAFAGGALVVGAWIIAMWALLPVAWRVVPSFRGTAAAGSVLFLLFNNLAEELVYRGYLFLLLLRSYGAATAIVSTSVLFTLLHIQSGVPWPNALAGVLTSALIFAALFARWRSVPLVLAFHVGMNVTQEVLGLRSTGLTIFLPQFGVDMTPRQSGAVLVAVAVVNVTCAVAVLFARRSDARAQRSADDANG